ncbi:hypothetical protein Mal4_53990 [Maioricimonas rarisocia]|uniref:Uncharacterized protein n=1 Tax=Maioricimonas rarisocia TaxID=2528026 RepID=A0A517ZEZ3_9PLAN|nr:hypothetical protein [Maioricimonas rarisocia]QDU41034.1 hypothetical protein Mal4_53990 [Maioricimonas rarisocia]
MLTAEQIVISVQSFWRDHFPFPDETVWPGTVVVTATASRWVELWIDAWTSMPRRRTASDRLEIALVAHCFSRDRENPLAAYELASAARSTLEHHTVAIIDPADPEAPPVGHVLFREADLHDVGRRQLLGHREPLQQVLVALTAHVEEAATAGT